MFSNIYELLEEYHKHVDDPAFGETNLCDSLKIEDHNYNLKQSVQKLEQKRIIVDHMPNTRYFILCEGWVANGYSTYNEDDTCRSEHLYSSKFWRQYPMMELMRRNPNMERFHKRYSVCHLTDYGFIDWVDPDRDLDYNNHVNGAGVFISHDSAFEYLLYHLDRLESSYMAAGF